MGYSRRFYSTYFIDDILSITDNNHIIICCLHVLYVLLLCMTNSPDVIWCYYVTKQYKRGNVVNFDEWAWGALRTF